MTVDKSLRRMWLAGYRRVLMCSEWHDLVQYPHVVFRLVSGRPRLKIRSVEP